MSKVSVNAWPGASNGEFHTPWLLVVVWDGVPGGSQLSQVTLPDHSVTFGESLQQARSSLRPADQQQRSDRVEQCLADLTGDQRLSHVQCQRHRARPDQQPPRRPHNCPRRPLRR